MEPLDSAQLQQADNAIMEIAKQLWGILGVIREPLQGIVWLTPNYPLDWPEFARGGKLVLRTELKGKLTPAEWRPLLASSLVFETRFRGRERLYRAYGLSSLAISIFLTIFFLLFASRLLPAGPVYYLTARAYSTITIFFFFAVFFLLVALPDPYFRKLRLRADQIVTEQLGIRQDLLTVLKKIDDMSISSGGRLAKLISPEPTISRRIQYLASS